MKRHLSLHSLHSHNRNTSASEYYLKSTDQTMSHANKGRPQMHNWGNWNLNNATVGGPSSSFDVVFSGLDILANVDMHL